MSFICAFQGSSRANKQNSLKRNQKEVYEDFHEQPLEDALQSLIRLLYIILPKNEHNEIFKHNTWAIRGTIHITSVKND
jgi:hypothetical protein